MNQTDVYYRALLGYRQEVGANRACARDTRIYADADGLGRITVTRAVCTVDEAWVLAIEEGLVHIEKAIKEERQFIYSNGEVVPIEKVKNISKDSVVHLARHAELITREQEGENIVPDNLYTVERLSDYAVYENRFLYMLLCYLRDFVTLRYQKILELTNRYDGRLEIDREIRVLNRSVDVKIEMWEERRDDAYLREHNPAKALLDRIDLILKTILSFLATPLMESAAKVAMLKPPITKTNVLKMDNNFKGAVALYDYIIAYDGLGYTMEENVHNVEPFRDEVSEDMAEAERLLSFLTYRFGLGLDAELKVNYEIEEARRREEELREKTEQMDAIRRRLAYEGQPIEAYILFLEKQVRALQNEADRLQSLYAELEAKEAIERRLNDELDAVRRDLIAVEEKFHRAELAHAEELRQTVDRYEQQIDTLKIEHNAATVALQDQHTAEVTALNAAHAEAIDTLHAEHEKAVMDIREAHSAELSELVTRYTGEITALKDALETEVTRLTGKHEAEVADMRQELKRSREELETAADNIQSLNLEQHRLRARILALRADKNDITEAEMEAMTEEAAFEELERELESFIRFYKKQWSRTKRKIRRDLLNLKYIKGQSNED